MSDEHENIPEEPAEPSAMDPAEVEALLHALDSEGTLPAGPEAALAADSLGDETPLGEVDADGLLIQTPAGPPAPDPVSIDELDFDAVLSAVPAKYTEPPPAPDDVAENTDAVKEPDAELPAALMSQEDLDALLVAATASPLVPQVAAPEPTESVEAISQPIESVAPTTQPGDDVESPEATGEQDRTPLADVESVAESQAISEPERDAPLAADGEISAAATGDAVAEGAIAEAADPESAIPPAETVDQAELDHLMEMSQFEPGPEAAPTREEAAEGSGALNQSELDALIAGMGDDAPLAGGALDSPVVALEEGEAVSLSKDNVDELLGSLSDLPAGIVAEPEASSAAVPAIPPAPATPATPAAPVAPAGTAATAATAAPAEVSDDMINALVAAAATPKGPEPSEEIGSENLAAAATATSPGAAPAPASEAAKHEQDDLERLIEESRRRAALNQPTQFEGQAENLVPMRARKMPRSDSALLAFLSANAARVVASAAAAILVGGATFVWLYAQQTRVPDIAVLATQRSSALQEAMDAARRMIDEGEYQRAASTLEAAIDGAPAGRERTDAKFMRLEALYKSVDHRAPLSRFDAVQSEIDMVLAEAPEHPDVPLALHWKALLHEHGDLPFAALDTYDLLITQHPSAAHMDEILVEAARLALELGVPDKAARYADQAVRDYPNSRHFAEAKLLQGDAYARAGQRDAARQLYSDALASGPTSPMYAEAVLRLGQLAFDEGNYEDAVTQIRGYLAKSTIPEGNDAAYLLLARALRKEGKNAEARDALNDMLRFFPASEHLPEAFVELSETLEALGERKAALHIAQEGGVRYPTNPTVLKNLGEMLGLDGNPFSAATTLLAADTAGANDPLTLLTAARQFRTAGMLDQAQRTYAQLMQEYGGSPESFIGGVELAEMIYDAGDAKKALERLEQIATATEGTERQLPALLAMAKIYDAVGLESRVAEVSRKAAGLSDDPEILARAAAALIKAGSLTEGQAIADRVDIAEVPSSAAYDLLSALGTALLQVDPPRGIDRLEEAYANYPEARMAANDFALVEAYLDGGRSAGARRVVLDMAAKAQGRPEDAPYVIDAASAWGDYLYDQGDYRAAADAYTIADDAAASSTTQITDGKRTDHRWPRYQRANALMKLGDFSGSFALYSEIAASDAPWAKEAAVKADFVKLQQAARGELPAELADATASTTSSAG